MVTLGIQPNMITETNEDMVSFALVGNPNSGKSTIFNALTKSRQKIGNYSGVTIERKEGVFFSQHGKPIKIIDLPGSYSMEPSSPEEEIMKNVLTGQDEDIKKPDFIIYVIDASHLERNLYLATQVIELGIPTIVVLNMVDIAEKSGIHINTKTLSKLLGTKIIVTQGNSKKGIINLKLAISQYKNIKCHPKESSITHSIKKLLHISSLENLIENRYKKVEEIYNQVINKTQFNKQTITEYLDSILLHPFFGFIFLILILGSVFWTIFSFAEIPASGINSLVHFLQEKISLFISEGAIKDLIVKGVLPGIGSIITFLPQILSLFFFIGLLESTGYMARAAFILDRLMSIVGLPGRAFIPILSAHACAVPAIMSTRIIKSKKDRLTTMLVAPFTSCSARLPIYLLMIASMIPSSWKYPAFFKASFLIGAYTLGLLATFVTAWLLKKTILTGKESFSIMELPSYKLPSIKHIITEMLDRGYIFLKRAATVILGLSVLLWVSLNYPKKPENVAGSQLEYSFAGHVGKTIEPAITPLGYDWKIGVGILSSFAAREIFISTMSIIYNVEKKDDRTEQNSLKSALENQKRPDGSKLFTPLVCLSLMVFYIFALQCVSTLVVIFRETDSLKWPIIQFVYMLAFAYISSLIVYQIGRLMGYA